MKIKILQAIKDYVITNYKKININEFKLGESLFNRRCHINSIQKVKEGKAKKVFLCFTVDNNNSLCIHFINQLKNGKYQDNTWGWLYEQTDYYIIREIDRSEYNNIWAILDSTREMLFNLHSNKFQRFIFGIKKDII